MRGADPQRRCGWWGTVDAARRTGTADGSYL